MGVILEGFLEAIKLLLTLDPDVISITLRTLQVTGIATFISVLIGIPIGTVLALTRFPGRALLVSIVNFGMGLPSVVVGLATWLCLTRYGPLGLFDLLYTPTAMVIAQAIIASPLVAGFSLAAIQPVNPKMRVQFLAFGTTRLH